MNSIQIKIIALSALSTVISVAPNHIVLASSAAPAKVSQAISRQPFRVAASTQSMEQSVLTKINQYRASRRLPPLTLDSRISAQARSHSQAMASGRVPFSHNGFQQRVQTIARSISYRGAAENVFRCKGYSDPADEAVKSWLKSPEHLKNIQGNYGLTGIGVAQNAKGEYFFTQIFFRQK